MDDPTPSLSTACARFPGAAETAALAPVESRKDPAFPGMNFRPAPLVRRQAAEWRGLGGELVAAVRRQSFESEHCGPRHLLIAYERGERDDGETIVGDLPPSTLHDLTYKLVFVPAGCRFREWQNPRVLLKAVHLYLCPLNPLAGDHDALGRTMPRLFFESAVLWQTMLKLRRLIEAGPSASHLYAEALALVLFHELLERGAAPPVPASGGLAPRQRRAVAQYVEENLAEQISLATLAGLAGLSPYHFARAFKQSFGTPPHHYLTGRRIDRAKTLLAKPHLTVTDIAFEVGFGQTSSFSTAFRRLVGQTPTSFRRCLL